MRTATYIACAAALVLSAACDRTPDADDRSVLDDRNVSGTTGTADTSRRADGTVDVADLMSRPDAYFGQTVTVVADVEEVFGPMAFALDEDAPLRGGIDRDLLVIGKQAQRLESIDDQWLNNKVRVTGTVGRLEVVEVEREVGWDLDPQLEAELEHAGAIVIASSVTRVAD